MSKYHADHPPCRYVHGSTVEPDGKQNSFFSCAVPVKHAPLWWHEKGLIYTASGYGSRIPTEYKIKFNGRWRRVYCRIYGNAGTCYIGKLQKHGERMIVREYSGRV